jgi:hypothetical protein
MIENMKYLQNKFKQNSPLTATCSRSLNQPKPNVYFKNNYLMMTSNLGGLLRGQASLPCVALLVLLVTAAKILALKLGTSIDLVHLPCQPTCLALVL